MMLGAPLFAQPSVPIVWGETIEGTIPIVAGSQQIACEFVLSQLSFPGAPPMDANGVLIAVYEPASQQFWWTYQGYSRPTDLASAKKDFIVDVRLVLDGNRIVGFAASGRGIFVRVFSIKFPSMAAALSYLRDELTIEMPKIHSGQRLFQVFNLSEVLGVAFFKNKGGIGGPAGRGIQLRSVTKSKDGWELEVVNELDEPRVVVFDDALTTVRAK